MPVTAESQDTVALETQERSAPVDAFDPVAEILDTYENGMSAVFLSGRSIYDLVASADDRLMTILEHFRRSVRDRYGMVTLTYSVANGLDWDAARMDDARDRRTVETALRAHGLFEIRPDEHEVVRVMRGIGSLARTTTDGLQWANGRSMHFAFVIEFAEHLTPGGDQVGRTDQEIRAIELAHILGQSNALRRSGNLVLLHGREGRVDELVAGVLHAIRLRQPDEAEKRRFLSVARRVYPNATFEAGITEEDVARLVSNTPNRGLEGRMRSAHLRGRPVTVEDLLEQKSRDVEELSEHTLTCLDTRRIEGLRLAGRNIAAPQRLLLALGNGLLHGNPHIPANVVLVGAPGTGKTDLALLVAREARASAYQVHSPKGGIVGETERKAQLQTTALAEWTPNVAFVDEITEALPLQRSEFDGDSGASRAVTAALLTTLSDENRRGRSLLIATTNCAWRMSAAMRSRFTLVPVLSPLREDYAAIVCAVAARISKGMGLAEEEVRGAGDVFCEKGASPREIRGALSLALLTEGSLTPDVVRRAAEDLCPASDRASYLYADLWAIKVCTSKRYFPWYDSPERYPFPSHLQGLVDPRTGDVDVTELDRRISEMRPHANV